MATRQSYTKSSDGPVSLFLNRHISTLISSPLSKSGVTPNVATLIALGIGIGGGIAFVLHIWWLGGVLLQSSSIFSGVDGEIARRTGKTSRYGDFLDTIVDRFVEYGALLMIAYGLDETWGTSAWVLGLFALGGTFMLASASEKYRSTMKGNYPKRQFEPMFAYLASGRDVRIFFIALASILASALNNTDLLFWTLVGLTTLIHLNFIYRVLILRKTMEK